MSGNELEIRPAKIQRKRMLNKIFYSSCQWMMTCCCCGVRTSAVLIFSLYLLVHAAVLAITILFMTKPEENLAKFLDLVDTDDSRLESSYFYASVKPYILQVGKLNQDFHC